MRRFFAATILALLIALSFTTTAGGATAELTFNITDSRAYAYKISVGKEVIQVSGLAPCDPATDPYGCDKNRYNRQPNCPGPKAVTINPDPIGGVDLKSGGAGQGTGVNSSGKEPEKASPVKINELLTVGTLSKGGLVAGAGGVASDTLVDLDGRANPEAHAESDGFVTNKNRAEERCDPANSGSYVHVVSRSGQKPETYSLAECFDDGQSSPRCGRSGSTEGRPSARRAYSIVQINEAGGKVFAKLKSFVANMSMGSGTQSLGVESMTTFLSLESDGTRSGLKWSAISSASGVTLGGQPVTLRPGETIEAPGGCVPGVPCVGPTHVGLAGPYVTTSNDGSKVLMIAPGLFYATTTQTTYVAGAELRAGLGRAVPFSFSALGFGSSSPLGLIRPGPAPFGSELPTDLGAAPVTGPVEGGDPIISVKRLATEPYGLASLIGFGGLALAIVLAGWLQRFAWGRRLYRLQPLRSINWMYRAFVRT